MEGIVTIGYGSQTGTSEDVARRLRRRLTSNGIPCRVGSLDDLLPTITSANLVVFICSTTGQGDHPDNMARYWLFLMRKATPHQSQLRYSVLGLGDSSYSRYNFVAKKLHRRLDTLGAEPLLPLVLGDDQHDHGIEAVVRPWMDSLVTALTDLLGVSSRGVGVPLTSPYRVEFNPGHGRDKELGLADVYNQKHPYPAALLSNVRLTDPNHWQDVRLIRLNISGSDMGFEPGDVLAVQPNNSDEFVDTLFRITKLSAEETVSVTVVSEAIGVDSRNGDAINPDTRHHPPSPGPPSETPWVLRQCSTVRDIIQKFLDITAVPRFSFFELLALWATDPRERERLEELTSTGAYDDLLTYCYRPRRRTIECLQDFPKTSSELTLEQLFDLLPCIQPRSFSIASSLAMHPDEVQLLVAVVRYRTNMAAPRLGLCSHWLSGLCPGSIVPVWVRHGTFTFMARPPTTPLVMVGPGTGLAPFRSYIQSLVARKQANCDLLRLYFGNRKETCDFLCGDELSSYAADKLLSLTCCWSRDQARVCYVWHKLQEDSTSLWEAINRRCVIAIAGSAKQMPADVIATIKTIIQKEGEMDQKTANKMVERMEISGQIQMETWS